LSFFISSASLNLVVLRSSDLTRAANFYTLLLGLEFVKHRHGNGPEHFSAELGALVFELYPLVPDGPSTSGTRLGFRVPSLEAALVAVSEPYPNAVLSPPKDSEWGRRAVIADPDGHRVELLERTSKD
jgi:lactoylglutathione lyase